MGKTKISPNQDALFRPDSIPPGKRTIMTFIKPDKLRTRQEIDQDTRIERQVEAARVAVLEGNDPNLAIKDERRRQRGETTTGRTSIQVEPKQDESDKLDPRIEEQIRAAVGAGGRWREQLNRGIDKNQAIIRERQRQRLERM